MRQTIACQTIARQTIARQTIARQTIARQTIARQTIARQTIARQTIARQTIARQTIARQTIARQTTAALTNNGFNIRQHGLIRRPDPNGSFQYAIPMKHVFGFMDDYTKVAYGMRDTLQLIRKDDNDAMFHTAGASAGKVVLSKLAWSVPIVQPNDVRKVNLYKGIVSNNVIPVSFRMRQCETC